MLFYWNKFLQSEIKKIIKNSQQDRDTQADADDEEGVVGGLLFWRPDHFF